MPEPTPPAPELDPPPAESARGISLVWLVPLLALVVALALAWRTYYDRGPLIEIVFENAAGVEAGKTPVRFRDVGVGIVERTSLSADLQHVIVTVRVNKDVARYLDGDAQFWLVRPSVTPQGVTGIETVLSGVYIGAYWNTQAGERQTRFDGLPRAPLTPADEPGLRIRLRSPDGGSMTIGAPVLFKRIQVGRIEDISLTDAGDVMIDLFVGAPNDIRVTQGSRFWNASGFSINLGGGGASLNVESLISLLQGGISFDTVGSDTASAEDGHVFELYPSEAIARQNEFEDIPGARVVVDTVFDGSVRGLQPGAAVEYHGLKVGEVRSMQAIVIPEDAVPAIKLRATLALIPQRLGITDQETSTAPDAALDLLETQVEQGLRAQLAASGILTQSLYVDLAQVRDAPPASLDRDAEPNPLLPSAPSEIAGIAASAETMFQRVAKLPLEDLVNAAVSILENANAIVTSDGVRQAPENLGLLLADARRLIGDSGIQEAPAQVAAILASARALVDQATQQQLVANLNDVLATAKTSLASIGTAADGVPELLSQVEALAAKANALPLDQLVTSANDVVDGIDAFVRSDGVAKLPASAQASLDDLRAVVADLRTGGAVDNLNATLASARQVADQAAQAQLVAQLNELLATTKASVASVGAAADGVPPLLDQVEALAAKANALPLDQLVTSANGVLGSIDAFVKSDDFANLPASAQASLSELRGVVIDLRAGGAIENVTASLASVRQITDEFAAAKLVDSIKTVVAEAEAAIGNLNSASQGLPKLMDSVNAISGNIEALPLEDLVTTGTRVLGTADAFLASQGVQDVPPKLNAALEELRAILAELNAGGAAQNVNATLASASRAADAVTVAAADLPALVARFKAVADAADAALASIGPNSRINRDTLLLLQEVRDAARSVDQLARTLQRQPNSVLFGR